MFKYRLQSVVTYKCKYGFMIVGDGTRTCGEDKMWSGTRPQCKVNVVIICNCMMLYQFIISLPKRKSTVGRQEIFPTVG